MINAQVLIDISSHTSDAIKVTIICILRVRNGHIHGHHFDNGCM